MGVFQSQNVQQSQKVEKKLTKKLTIYKRKTNKQTKNPRPLGKKKSAAGLRGACK